MCWHEANFLGHDQLKEDTKVRRFIGTDSFAMDSLLYMFCIYKKLTHWSSKAISIYRYDLFKFLIWSLMLVPEELEILTFAPKSLPYKVIFNATPINSRIANIIYPSSINC